MMRPRESLPLKPRLHLKIFIGIVCTVFSATTICAAQLRDNSKALTQIRETIAEIQAMKGPASMARMNEAEHLSDLTKKINPKSIDDKTLAALISLLDNAPDDSVRLWVAVAIGNLGPRARAAAPALLRDIRETDCISLAELTSAGAARIALNRIGVKPPPRKCGEKDD
jgi:hypothetical protein